MIKDFLNSSMDNTAALEAVSNMAIMLGEDPSVACESDTNAEGVVARFKTRVAGIVTKIKEFIQKIVNWIKTKFFQLLKMDTQIDKNMWDDAQKILALCDKAQMGPVDKLIAKMKTAVAVKKEDLQAYMTLKAEVEDSVEAVTTSEAYKLFKLNKYAGSNKVNVRGKSLEGQKAKFSKALESLQEASKSIQSDIDKAADDGSVKKLEIQMVGVNADIRLTTIRMEVINKLMTSGTKVVKEEEKK